MNRGKGRTTRRPVTTGLVVLASVLVGVLWSSMSGATPAVWRSTHPGSNWPLYGFDHWNSRHNGADGYITRTNVGTLRPVWSKGGLEGVAGTPAVFDGVAYFADLTGTLWAVEVSSGQVLWQTKVAPGAVGAPAVTNGSVYIGSANTLYRVDRASGALVWKTVTNSNPYAQISASPVVIGNEVVMGTASFEVFVNSTTYTFQGSIGAYSTETGAQLWDLVTTPNNATSGAGEGIWSTPAVDRSLGLLFVGTGQNLSPPGGPLEDSILAINYKTGKLVWHFQGTTDDVFSFGYPSGHDYDFGASPNLFKIHGETVVGDGAKSGVYYALDAATGSVVWQTRVSAGGSFGGVLGSAALVDGELLVPANNGNQTPETSEVVALDKDTGAVQWTHPTLGYILGPVSAEQNIAFVSSSSAALVALDSRTGSTLWSYTAPAQAACGPSIVGPDVLWGYGYTFTGPPGLGGVIDFRVHGG